MNKKVINKEQEIKKFATLSERELLMELRTSLKGLSKDDAKERLEEFGLNQINAEKPMPAWRLLLEAFKDPFIFVLAFLMIVSFATHDQDAGIVMAIMIIASAILTFSQEYRAQKASHDLKNMIENTCAVTREGVTKEIPMDEVVPGDIVTLATGDMIPADAVLIWTKDLFINQSSLTGESLPVEKYTEAKVESSNEELSAIDMKNLVFMGTDILSGQGKAIILKTGQETFFGDIAQHSTKKRGKTAFDEGLTRISKFLLRMIVVLFPVVFLINGLTKGQWDEAFFFAIAVAVGLTPEMLPMIVTSNLAKGALSLSKEKVIVKELSAIQNLGSMDVLCTDKTGTITEDRVVLVQHVNPLGEDDDRVLDLTFMNSNYQTGWKNVMDVAVIDHFKKNKKQLSYQTVSKIDEIPFDFSRRRLTVVLGVDDHQLMITKGAVEEMEEVCSTVEIDGKVEPLTEDLRKQMKELSQKMNEQGMRVLTIAIKKDNHYEPVYSIADEKEMTLVGFAGFLDPAKESAVTAIDSLHRHGVAVKVLTGDNEIVAKKVCQDVGISADKFLLGPEIEQLSDAELTDKVDNIHLFAKLTPMQKTRIIQILQSKKHTVGFMGDGINDAPALRTADVGISVDTSADITKDASSIILLEKSLNVLEKGVVEGRKVFKNMMKYIKITISSNFGNVFSILVASAFLPFLPMLSLQLLVQNLIYDMTQLSIPFDRVDEEELMSPVKWQVGGLLKFTVFIGPISSIFDILTFLLMWFIFGANTPADQGLFQAGWFAVGIVTQILIVHIVRTRKSAFTESRASKEVWGASILGIFAGLLFVMTPLRSVIDFEKLPLEYWFWFIGILVCYLIVSEGIKKIYIRKTGEWI